MKKVHDDIAHIAQELLENFAARSLRKGAMYTCNRDEIQKFQESFGFPYTPDQEDCITDILSDMQSEKNMDRLIVGDVGF